VIAQAESFFVAVHLVELHSPDVVLMDLIMPARWLPRRPCRA